LRSLDHATYIKEKLIFQFYKKVADENRDKPHKWLEIEQPSSALSAKPSSALTNRTSDMELLDTDSIDSEQNDLSIRTNFGSKYATQKDGASSGRNSHNE